jgi:GTP-binding protein HflX
MLSALTGEGKDALFDAIEARIKALKTKITALIPYSYGALLNLVHKNGEVISESHEEGGTRVCAYVPPDIAGKLKEFLT